MTSTETHHRLVVVGTSGSGKTTLAHGISERLRIPRVELDALNWEPDWIQAPVDVFRARVEEATRGNTWVVDGNYGKARDIIWGRAELVVWLDYPLWVVLWQLFKRSARRLFTREELWSGNRERWQDHLGRDSLFLWAITSHAGHRQYPEIVRTQYPHLQLVRLRSPREARQWLNALASTPGDPLQVGRI